jgi:hypothetical protein
MRNRMSMLLSVIVILMITAAPAFAGGSPITASCAAGTHFLVVTYALASSSNAISLELKSGSGSPATISASGASGTIQTTWTGANLNIQFNYEVRVPQIFPVIPGVQFTIMSPQVATATVSCSASVAPPTSPVVNYGTLPPAVPSFSDGRLTNRHGDQIAVFSTVEDGKIGLQVWLVDGLTVPAFALDISAGDIEEAQAQEGVTVLMGESEDRLVRVFKLDSGEIQINYGPDSEGKLFVYRFTDLRVGAYTFEVIDLP